MRRYVNAKDEGASRAFPSAEKALQAFLYCKDNV